MTLFILYLVFALVFIGSALLYHSLFEIVEAKELKQRIKTIGLSQKIKGLDREARI